MKSGYYLNNCPLCGADVNKNNTPPFLGGIECPKCRTIFQFPMVLDEETIRIRFNYRQTDRSVFANFAIAVTIAATSAFWIFELFFDKIMIALR